MDCIDEDGNTALHYAAEGGFDSIVKFLVDKGANLNAVNDEGDTALHKATINNFVGVIKLLLAGQADVNAQVWPLCPLRKPQWQKPVAFVAFMNLSDAVLLMCNSLLEIILEQMISTCIFQGSEASSVQKLEALLPQGVAL